MKLLQLASKLGRSDARLIGRDRFLIFMFCRCTPLWLALVAILGELLFINQALLPLWQLLLITAGAALIAPIITLFFATVAENKVAGFAYSKFAGISGMVIMISYFVPEPWQWLMGLFPPFWICKAYWMAHAGANLWWVALAVGIVLQVGLIGWFMDRFGKVAYR